MRTLYFFTFLFVTYACNASSTAIVAIEQTASPLAGEDYSLSTDYPPTINDYGRVAFVSGGRNRVFEGNALGVNLIAKGIKFGNPTISGDEFDNGTKRVYYASLRPSTTATTSTLSPLAINNNGQVGLNLSWYPSGNSNNRQEAMAIIDNGIYPQATDGDLEPSGGGDIYFRFNYVPALNN